MKLYLLNDDNTETTPCKVYTFDGGRTVCIDKVELSHPEYHLSGNSISITGFERHLAEPKAYHVYSSFDFRTTPIVKRKKKK